MLNNLFQKAHSRHRALPLLGSILDDFDDWLNGQGYRYATRQCYVLRCTAIEQYFKRRKQCNLSMLTPEKMRECWQFHHRRPGGISNTVTCLQRFLQSRQMLSASPVSSMPFSAILDLYRHYLQHVRGLAAITIEQHCLITAEFLQFTLQPDHTLHLADLTRSHIEHFITSVSHRFGRGTLQHVVAQLRGFLRFLAIRGEAPAELASQIDTPRVYRLEQLPRALPWDTVSAFLRSIDRTQVSGLRDYAMFSLVTAYGLRGCDIAGLKLTNIHWRVGEIEIRQSKTRQPLRLPLIDPVAEALLDYLRRGRPQSPYREIFLTVHAPIVPIKRQSVGYAFRFRLKHSGLWWTPFFGQKKAPSLDRAAALKMKESQCLKFARVTHPA